ncbi:MAG: 50S ribosomal protein L11 methyltransferase [Acidobacteriota bacterium]
MGDSQTEWGFLQLTVAPDQHDFITELLWELGTIGVEEKQGAQGIILKAFFSDATALFSLKRKFHDAAAQRRLQVEDLRVGSFQDNPQEWIRNWKKNFRPFAVGESFYIYPSWGLPSPDYRINLCLEPGQAFGTGSHESTQLCLLALEQLAKAAASLLDVGTGAGILAIAARKLNPASLIVAMDIDPQSAKVARENFIQNSASGILLFAGTLENINRSFQLVVANLTLEIFRAAAPQLRRVAEERLIVSGFTREQGPLVLEEFSPLQLGRQWEKNGWLCFELLK